MSKLMTKDIAKIRISILEHKIKNKKFLFKIKQKRYKKELTRLKNKFSI